MSDATNPAQPPAPLTSARARCGTALLTMAAAALTAASAAAQTPEPAVVRTVTQDDQVRIEETRVRGAVQRIVVEQKAGGSYEIMPPSATADPSRSPTPRSGERRWRLFSF
jgi:hypothetical protein